MPASAILIRGEWVVVTQPPKVIEAMGRRRVQVKGKLVAVDSPYSYEAMTVRSATPAEIAEVKRNG